MIVIDCRNRRLRIFTVRIGLGSAGVGSQSPFPNQFRNLLYWPASAAAIRGDTAKYYTGHLKNPAIRLRIASGDVFVSEVKAGLQSPCKSFGRSIF